MLIFTVDLMLSERRQRLVYFGLSDACLGTVVVDSGFDVSESLVVIGLVLEINEPLRTGYSHLYSLTFFIFIN